MDVATSPEHGSGIIGSWGPSRFADWRGDGEAGQRTVFTVRNPSGNSTALTITPIAGGTRPNSASLVIEQIG